MCSNVSRRAIHTASSFVLFVIGCGGAPPVPSGSQAHATPAPVPGASSATPKPLSIPAWTLPSRESLRARMLEIAKTRNFRTGLAKDPTPTKDGTAVLYMRAPVGSIKAGLFEFDIPSGQERELLAPTALLSGDEELSPEEKARRERMRITTKGFTSFELSEDDSKVLLPFGGQVFIFERASRKHFALKTPANVIDPHFSHDAKSVAYVHANNVFIVRAEAKANPKALTKGGSDEVAFGTAEFVAQEELDRSRGFWFSPDDSLLLIQETDNRKVERLTLPDWGHPERAPERPFYPRAGKENAKVRLGLVRAQGGAITWLDWDQKSYPYLSHVTWTKNAPLTLTVLDRKQQSIVLLRAEPSGKSAKFFESRSTTWVNADTSMPRWLEDGSGFLMANEKPDGIEVSRFSKDGALVRVVVPAQAGYRASLRLSGNTLQYIAGTNPSESGLYSASLEGPDLRAIAALRGKEIDASPKSNDRTQILLEASWSEAPRWRVRDANGAEKGVLPESGSTKIRELHTRHMEVGGIQVVLVDPTGMPKDAKRPIIDSIYGGPHVMLNHANALAYTRAQWMADATGATIALIDGRGTPRKNPEWEHAIYKHFGDVPLEDHVKVLKELEKTDPALDTKRIGIYGWSFGGYLAARAILAYPDVYRVGVAGAAPAEWTDYDTCYTERYLGIPEEDKESYERASLLPLIKQMKFGEQSPALLVIHGTADDNVYFINALKLTHALARANHPFDFWPLPDTTHLLVEPELTSDVWMRTPDYLRSHLQ